MNHNAIKTHPTLETFLRVKLSPQGQLLINEELHHDHVSKNTMSLCCDQETYQMDGEVFCGYCGCPACVNY